MFPAERWPFIAKGMLGFSLQCSQSSSHSEIAAPNCFRNLSPWLCTCLQVPELPAPAELHPFLGGLILAGDVSFQFVNVNHPRLLPWFPRNKDSSCFLKLTSLWYLIVPLLPFLLFTIGWRLLTVMSGKVIDMRSPYTRGNQTISF